MAFLQDLIGRLRPTPQPPAPTVPARAAPSEARLRFERGSALFAQGDAQGASEALAQAIALRAPGDDFLAQAQLLRARACSALGDPGQALACLQAALAVQAGWPEALREGVPLLHRLQRHDEAVAWADAADDLAREPGSAAEWLARGNAALQTWDLPTAQRCYRHACAADPANPQARLNRAFVTLEQGDAPAAIGLLQQALALHGAGTDAGFLADAQFLLGRAWQRQGDSAHALAAFEAALAARPDLLEAIEEALPLLHAAKRHAEALTWAQRLQAARPDAAATLLVAKALAELERPAEALQAIESVLLAHPDHAEAWTGKGHLLLAQGRAEEALAAFDRALALAGDTPVALANVASALARAGRREAAVLRYRELLQRDPDNVQYVIGLIVVLLDLLRPRDALEVSAAALARLPGHTEVVWASSCAHLMLGDFAQGWQAYESRWRAERGTRPVVPDFGRPLWLGREDLADKTLLLTPEQGLGDCIQFLRYVPLAAARARTVLLSLTEPLCELVQASGLPANCVLVPPGGVVDSFDLLTPLMSLPLALGMAQPLPAPQPYLHADASRVDPWRRRLQALGERKLNVGVTWSGNPEHANDHNRSIPLHAFRAIEAAGCRFISLQPAVRASDRPALADWPGLLPWGEELRNFMDTAALMQALDVVVAVDTSVVHLAGALGRPTRVLLPYVPDWRWMLDRDDSPWYPSVRLRRQATRGDWPGVLAAVRAELEGMAVSATTGQGHP